MSTRIPAVFMRGGTSKGLVFLRSDLPEDRSEWDALFLSAMGSPDPYGRQLDGMGGGVSSLSKVCVVGPPSRPDADVDYTFAQVSVTGAKVDYSSNCGNMSSAIGPFSLMKGLVRADGAEVVVRIHNTNTGKVIHASFSSGASASQGKPMDIPGVSRAGLPIRLDFLSPGGATTGRLLPTGRECDTLAIPGIGDVEVSMVDAANACVFIDAATLGLDGTEMPAALSERPDLLHTLETIRRHASVAMGVTASLEQAAERPVVPFLGIVSAPQASPSLAGMVVNADDVDLTVRMLANGLPHLALPVTASLCTAVSAGLEGTLVHRHARSRTDGPLRLGMPSGVLNVEAEVTRDAQERRALRGSFYRTARVLFDGFVHIV